MFCFLLSGRCGFGHTSASRLGRAFFEKTTNVNERGLINRAESSSRNWNWCPAVNLSCVVSIFSRGRGPRRVRSEYSGDFLRPGGGHGASGAIVELASVLAMHFLFLFPSFEKTEVYKNKYERPNYGINFDPVLSIRRDCAVSPTRDGQFTSIRVRV